jgi:hypothetical protein
MIRLKYRLVILFFLLFSFNLQAQFDARWVLGTFSQLCFSPPPPSFEKGDFDVLIPWNNASICKESTGELLIFCHGSIIFNKLGLPMQNGDTINPGKYFFNNYPTDQPGYEGSLILPLLNQNNKYIVLYTNVDSLVPGQLLPTKLYYSIIDMSFNNGLGKVIKKDVPLLDHLLEPGRINAIQHANGRDWWIIINGFNDLQHFIFLLNPNGINLYSTQTIGSYYNVTTRRDYQTCVNQSGSQIAYLYGTHDTTNKQRIDLYDFDRCVGLLSNYKTIALIDTELNGVSFSPNDSLLYVNNLFKLYQFNIKDSTDTAKILIDRYNGTLDPFQVLFGMQKIAPDNKIYMGTWNGSRRLHCITKPNIRGKGCNFIQGYLHTDSLNQAFQGSLPNYPNFRLGVLKGSECDTIREAPPEVATDDLIIYPNPSKGIFAISYKLLANAKIQVYDVLGREIMPLNTTYTGIYHATIDVSNLASGMYFLKVTNTNSKMKTVKFVKQ